MECGSGRGVSSDTDNGRRRNLSVWGTSAILVYGRKALSGGIPALPGRWGRGDPDSSEAICREQIPGRRRQWEGQ